MFKWFILKYFSFILARIFSGIVKKKKDGMRFKSKVLLFANRFCNLRVWFARISAQRGVGIGFMWIWNISPGEWWRE